MNRFQVLHKSLLDFPLMNTAFWKLVSTSTMCSSELPYIHIIYIEISLLNTMFYSGMLALHRNGSIEFC